MGATTNNYGFSEELITEAILIEKDKHGFIRKTVKDMDIQGDDVVFFDYDGTILHSYKADAFLHMPEMPKNPTHDGLISRGWNWSYEDAQAYVQKYGKLNVGQMYAPADGKTHIKIHIPEDGRPNFKLCFTQTVADGVIVDWGDGSETDTSDITDGPVHMEHTYAKAGRDYEITLKTIDGCEIGYGYQDDDQNVHLTMFDEPSENAPALSFYITALIISNSVTNVEKNAFYGCWILQSLIIPDSVTSIEEQAFRSCGCLQSLVIPDSVISIGTSAFVGCYTLSSLSISNSVTSIGEYAFSSCFSLQSLTIPDSVTNIGGRAFANCYALQSMVIPESVVSIGYYAFASCYALRSIVIPDSVTSIEQGVFSNCYVLQSLTIPDSITSIAQDEFVNCQTLRSLVIPDSVTSIGNRAFSSCFILQSLVIPDSVISIGTSAFATCTSLRTLIIPDSVTSIGGQAFEYCVSLRKCIIQSSTPSTLGTNAFRLIPSDAKILVPAESVDAYKAASGWSTYSEQIFAIEEE